MVKPDPEYLGSLSQIIQFTGMAKSTFYANKYDDNLKKSAYLFSRPGPYGRTIYWSYKRLILVWLSENFHTNMK